MPKFVRIHDGPSLQPDGSGLERLQLDELPMPEPQDDEVRIKVEAFGLNYGDFNLMDNNYTFLLEKFPSTFSGEACGMIDALGPHAKHFKVGDRVATLPRKDSRRGVSGEYALLPEYYVTTCPENLTSNEGASVWVQYLTAYYALYTEGHIRPGDYLLNCAASSSAGIAATELGKLAGATVIGTTRGTDNVEFILETGADHVISTEMEDIGTRILEITNGHGVRLIYDPIGGELTQQYAKALGHKAIIFYYGILGGLETVLPMVEMIRKAAVMMPYSVFNYIYNPELKQEAVTFIYDALLDGRLKPRIDRTFPLEDFRAAYEYQWIAKNRRGKILINP